LFAVLLSHDVHQVVGVVIPLEVQQLLPIVLILHYAVCEQSMHKFNFANVDMKNSFFQLLW
jgi:hypothetical protein